MRSKPRGIQNDSDEEDEPKEFNEDHSQKYKIPIVNSSIKYINTTSPQTPFPNIENHISAIAKSIQNTKIIFEDEKQISKDDDGSFFLWKQSDNHNDPEVREFYNKTSIQIENQKNLINSRKKEDLSIEALNLSLTPRDYQIEIYKSAVNRNSIVFMETGKGKTLIAIMIIANLFKTYIPNQKRKKPKVVFFVCDLSLIEQQKISIEQNTKLKVTTLQGKKSKKSKTNFEEFRRKYEAIDIFIAIPDVFYKLLSIGFIKIDDLDLIIFDECHHCDSNHSYNLIMTEFYFYYILNGSKLALPQIIGLTASPLKKKITKDVSESARKTMTELCENLNSEMIIDPDFLVSQNEHVEDYLKGKEYIRTQTQEKQEDYPTLIKALNVLFIKDFLNLCINSYKISRKKDDEFYYKPEELKKIYENFIKEKFDSKTFEEFTHVIMKYNEIYSHCSFLPVFRIFEKIQRCIFMILENLDLKSLFIFLTNYQELYFNKKDKDAIDDEDSFEFAALTQEETNEIKEIILQFWKGINELFESGLRFQSDRLNKLYIKIDKILLDNPQSKIIIFVANRIVADILSLRLNKHIKKINNKFGCVSVIGVNKKKTENAMLFNPSNTSKKMYEKIQMFNKGEVNILIGTSAVEEGLDIQSCNVVIVYTELHTPKSFIQMKGRARKQGALFLAFSNSVNNTIQRIKNFIELGECMKQLFNNGIVKDFRRQNFLMYKNYNNAFFFIKSTHAKLSLRNALPIAQEVVQNLNNLKMNMKIEKKVEEIASKNKNKGFRFIFEIFCDSFPGKKIEIKSTAQPDKQTAESECFLQLFIRLFDWKIITTHLRVNNNTKSWFK